ncbi:hypothetical protein [Streptomyces sp. AS02]|uniref:hypothetical protein n=1 Tax=Streptomyces sp. AS02 TaxID=2938946 RepID=UPI002020237A|nr:hypothetical protein [Streptomyces sp. AS02]MCL8017458.1 hypothetical protein [Streptomyces sp. AS02]
MLKHSLPKIALWITLGLAFTAVAVSLPFLAVMSGSDEEPDWGGGAGSTSWYTTRPETTDNPGDTEGPTEEPTEPDPGASSGPSGGGSVASTPVTVVTQTVVAVPSGGGGSDGPGTLITAFGSLLSGAAAVGTLLHAVHLSRQNRSATAATDDDASAASSS